MTGEKWCGDLTWLIHVVGCWLMEYNHYRPHSSLGYQTPAAYAEQCQNMRRTQPDRQAGEIKNMAEILSYILDPKKRVQITYSYRRLLKINQRMTLN